MLRKNCKFFFLKDGFPKWGPFFRIFRSIFPTFWSILLIFVYFSRFSEYFSECWAFFRICEVFFRISGIFPDFQLVHKYFFDFSGVFFQLFFYLGLASIFPTFQSIFSTFSEYFSDFSEYFSDFMVFSQKKPEREIFGQAGQEGWPPPPPPPPAFGQLKKIKGVTAIDLLRHWWCNLRKK